MDTNETPSTATLVQARARRIADRILVVVFLLGIGLPGLGTIFKWDFVQELSENRSVAAFPEMPKNTAEASKVPSQFFKWFGDHFGFRKSLIHSLAMLRYNTVGIKGSADSYVGKDYWVFCRRMTKDVSGRAERGIATFRERDLQWWQEAFERRHAWLAARGIKMLVVYAPDKQTIYPEMMPEAFQGGGPSRLDQLQRRLAESGSPVTFVDLRPALIAAKQKGQIYYSTDTHWNSEGAFIASDEIVKAAKALLPEFPIVPIERSSYELVESGEFSGDLARMVGLGGVLKERMFELRLRPEKSPPMQLGRTEFTDMETMTLDPRLPRALVLRDSFMNTSYLMIAPHFSRVRWLWRYDLDERIVEEEKPHLVIHEMVERQLWILHPPHDSENVRTTALPARVGVK